PRTAPVSVKRAWLRAKSCPSPHHAGAFGLNLVHDSLFLSLAIWVLVRTEILFRHLVDVRVCAMLGDFNNAAANLQIAVRVLRINDGQRNPRIAAHILILLAGFGGIDDDVVAFDVAPDGGDLR